MRVGLYSTVALALLAGCNRSPSVTATNASAAEVATKMAAAGGAESFVRPGQWSTTVTIDEMTAPGMPPSVQAQMKQHAAVAHTTASCLSPAEARKPTAEMFNGGSNNCSYNRFVMGGGKLDMDMRCTATGESGTVNQQMTVTGTYDPDHYEMAMTSATDTGRGGMGPMAMKMHLTAKRLGDCPAEKTKGN